VRREGEQLGVAALEQGAVAGDGGLLFSHRALLL
jgi:hypothetical protein